MPFLRNTWYVAMWSQDLRPGEVIQRTLLDQSVVFFRSTAGALAALQDRCPHRFAPLSLGKVCQDDRIQCPYHGLEFDATGACVRNPNAEGNIPPRLKVRSYPLAEKHGVMWIWMGDRAADVSRIPDFSVFDQSPASRILGRHCLEVEAGYELMTYNVLDISHINTLHAGILGNEDSFNFEIKAEERGDALYLRRSMPDVRPMRVNQLMFRKDIERVDQWSHMRWNAPGCVLNDAGVCPPGTSIEQGTGLYGIHFFTPQTETRTYYFSGILRNPMVRSAQDEAEIQKEMAELRRIAFHEQDKKILEAQQRLITQAGGMDALQQVPLSTDIATMRFKRILDRLIAEERAGETASAA